jgi:hypothetical protein
MGINLFEIMLIPNVVVLALAFVALSLKYEHYQKFHNAVTYHLSHVVGYRVRIVVYWFYDKYCQTNDSVLRPMGSRRNIFWQFHNKHNCVGISSDSELHNTFFRRPKPIIIHKILSGNLEHNEQILDTTGEHTPFLGGTKTAQWMNVTNKGNTTVKKMRARVKVLPLEKKISPASPPKPENMLDEVWQQITKQHEQFQKKLEEQHSNYVYGKPLPFSNTLRGTMAYPWVGVDRQQSYETDLTAKSDEASILVCAIYRPNLAPQVNPDGSARWTTRYYLEIGGTTTIVLNPQPSSDIRFSFAIKFWIVAENVSEDVSEIFYVEVPDSFETIICTKLKRGSKQYKDFDKLLRI